MKRTLFCLFFFAFLSLPGKAQRDKAIYERYCTAVKEKAALPTGDLMVETARFFLGTPYVAGTLEEEPETLVINLHGLDCMTLVENTAALAWSVKHRLAYDWVCFCLERYALPEFRLCDTRLYGSSPLYG